MMYVYLYAWEIMVTSWVCVCIMKKTTWNLLQSIKQKRRKHLQRVSRDARALCMTPHAFFLFFYFKCQVLFFSSQFLPPLLFLCDHSKKLHSIFEQERVTTINCSAIRNCEFFLNKTFFVVFHLVVGFYLLASMFY